jgi:nicotinate phosphoribosyltransferase
MIRSILDTDWYKLTIGQVVFNQFIGVRAHYKFFNRNNTPFPVGFQSLLQDEVEKLSDLKMTDQEYAWLSQYKYFKPSYLEWLKEYSFNPSEVKINQEDGGNLSIDINGPWYRTIFWEVPLMATISELYFQNKTPDRDWIKRLINKSEAMSKAGCKWADFGTRRRFSFNVQDTVVRTCAGRISGFLGTSNPHLAMSYGCQPIGTTAHEGPMSMQVLYGLKQSNVAWMDAWIKEYRGKLGIALCDTLTTDVFLRDFDSYYARVFDGVRQDSGDPLAFAEKIIRHYAKLNIDPKSKRIVFSDNLNAEKAIKIQETYGNDIQISFGIGTNLSNDVGVKPLNMVIKLVGVGGDQFTDEWPSGNCIKLSDEKGKYTGSNEDILLAKRELQCF